MDCDTHSPSVDRVDNPVPLCPDITKQSVPNLSALESSLKLGILSDEEKRKRSDILSTLYNTPVSSSLNAYFQMLEEGSSQWSIDMFIEGIKCMANLSGPERLKYFNEPFQGLHFSNSFTELWNKTHPQLPITLWDRDIRLRSPPSWSNELKESRHVLAYHGEAPLSQGLNELLKGPTTLDCGMFCQLVLWMAIRYLIGDRLFGKLFKFEKGQFVLTQRWEVPIDDTRTIGNLLYPFYDDPNDEETKDLDSQARIRTRTMFNHALYLFKHPGGVGRLQNVIQVDEYNIIFDPKAFQSLLSSSDIDQRFMQVYNAPYDVFDLEKIWLYSKMPDHVHPDFAPSSFGDMLAATKDSAGHTLGDIEWRDSQGEREELARGMNLAFNFERLISCLDKTIKDGDSFFSTAWRMKGDKREFSFECSP